MQPSRAHAVASRPHACPQADARTALDELDTQISGHSQGLAVAASYLPLFDQKRCTTVLQVGGGGAGAHVASQCQGMQGAP